MKKKLIVRMLNKNDRRVHRIDLTKQGKEILQKIIVISKEANNHFVEKLKTDQVDDLFKILNIICSSIETEE